MAIHVVSIPYGFCVCKQNLALTLDFPVSQYFRVTISLAISNLWQIHEKELALSCSLFQSKDRSDYCLISLYAGTETTSPENVLSSIVFKMSTFPPWLSEEWWSVKNFLCPLYYCKSTYPLHCIVTSPHCLVSTSVYRNVHKCLYLQFSKGWPRTSTILDAQELIYCMY